MADWRDKAKARVQDKQQGNRFKLTEGNNTFRILPSYEAIENDDYAEYAPYIEYLIHQNVGPNKRLVRCGRDVDTKKGECWLCDKIIDPYTKSGKSTKRAMAKQLEPVEQMAMLVARWDKNTESLRGPLLFFVPGRGGQNSTSVKVQSMLANSKRHYDHPRKGYNITITRTGTGPKDTRYGAPEADEESSVVPKSVIRKIKPFEEVIDPYDEEFQRATFFGDELEAAARRNKLKEEEDDNFMKKKKKSEDEEVTKKKKKKGKKVEDDEEEEETEDDEEEEEDEKPSKKKKKKSKSDDEDEEDEDEESEDEDEEDEDEEEEEPVKKKKKKKKSSDDEDEEDEEEEDEDEESDDDEDEDDVKKKKKKKKSKSDDDDDEEEEDEDEEEEDEEDEDEEPVKKKKKKKK